MSKVLLKGWLVWCAAGLGAAILFRWILRVINDGQFKLLLIIWPVGGLILILCLALQLRFRNRRATKLILGMTEIRGGSGRELWIE